MSKYPQSFIDRVKRAYPESARMHELAETGGYLLGRYLDDSSSGSISVDDIIKLLQADNNPEALLARAKREQERRGLYYEWYGLVEET